MHVWCGEIAAVILRKVERIWELTEQSCVFSRGAVLFCNDELELLGTR